MFGRWLRLAGMAFLTFVVPGFSPANAHEFPLNTVMNAFVKLEPQEAHLVIRVPLHVLTSEAGGLNVNFPVTGREIDLKGAGPATQQVLRGLGQGITIWEDGVRLVPATAIGRVSLPTDRSFGSYDQAVAHVVRPMAPGEAIFYNQGFFDAHITYPIVSPKSRYVMQMMLGLGLSEEYLKLVIRYMPFDEGSRAFVISSRSGRVNLNPTWYQAASSFVALGIGHILSGIDHLLFLFCLIIPFRRLRGLIPVVTAFTVAHSITLIASAYNLVPVGAWFPPLVETLIAVSIVYMALENIVKTDFGHRWFITGLFGLVHGFGFSYGLKEGLQFAGSYILVSLLSFNVGIELGQIAVLVVVLPPLLLFFRRVQSDRMWVIILSALVAHTGWHWMLDRGEKLWLVEWPTLDAAVVTGARWVLGILIIAGAAWFLRGWLGGQGVEQRPRAEEAPVGQDA